MLPGEPMTASHNINLWTWSRCLSFGSSCAIGWWGNKNTFAYPIIFPASATPLNSVVVEKKRIAYPMWSTYAPQTQGVTRGLNYIPAQRSCWGWGGGERVSHRPSVRLSVRPSRILCPLCSAWLSSGWIHFTFMHRIKQHKRCVTCKVYCGILKFEFLSFFFKFIALTISWFDLGSDVNQ